MVAARLGTTSKHNALLHYLLLPPSAQLSWCPGVDGCRCWSTRSSWRPSAMRRCRSMRLRSFSAKWQTSERGLWRLFKLLQQQHVCLSTSKSLLSGLHSMHRQSLLRRLCVNVPWLGVNSCSECQLCIPRLNRRWRPAVVLCPLQVAPCRLCGEALQGDQRQLHPGPGG